jgi:hypothetical protein
VIGIELCRVLGLPDTEGLTISRILATHGDGECSVLLKKLKVGALPDEERARLLGVRPGGIISDHLDDVVAETEEDTASYGAAGRIIVTAGSAMDPIGSSFVGDEGAIAEPPGARATSRDRIDVEDVDSESDTAVVSRDESTAVDQDGYEDEAFGDEEELLSDEGTSEALVAGDVDDETDSSRRSSGRRGHRHRRGTRARPTRVAEERLRSYVSAPNATTDPDDEFTGPDAEERKSIEAGAVRHVLAWERVAGRTPTDENDEHRNNPGYDVTSRTATGEVERYIEVKGVRGSWTGRGVMLTPKQFQFAATHGDRCWLYIVEHALTEVPPEPHRIRDFARRVWRFGFDDGWRAVEEVPSVSFAAPEIGMRIRVPSGRIGVVVSVSGVGALQGVELRMEDDGTVVREVWKPQRLHPLRPDEH